METRKMYVLRHYDHDRSSTIGVYWQMISAMVAARTGGFYDGAWYGSAEQGYWLNGNEGEFRRYPLIIECVTLNQLPERTTL